MSAPCPTGPPPQAACRPEAPKQRGSRWSKDVRLQSGAVSISAARLSLLEFVGLQCHFERYLKVSPILEPRVGGKPRNSLNVALTQWAPWQERIWNHSLGRSQCAWTWHKPCTCGAPLPPRGCCFDREALPGYLWYLIPCIPVSSRQVTWGWSYMVMETSSLPNLRLLPPHLQV